MSWETIRLGDVAKVSSSKRIFARQYVEAGIPFYRQKEIIDKKNKVEITEPLFISQETYDDIKNKFGVPHCGDLLITAVGVTLGIPYVVDDEIFYFKDGNLIWLSNFDKQINSKYLYYWITSDKGQKSMWSRTIGSAQPALTIDTIKQFEIPVPHYATQCKIVDILSAYDDLIENTQKQIKLLEEAALRFYKEWFVDFRFPGYEDVEIIDGIPEGWKTCSIADLCERIGAGGTPSRGKSNYWNNPTIKWYKTGELQDCWLIDAEEYISEDGLNNSSAKLFPKNTIIMAIYASPTLGRLGILSSEAACNQAALCLVADENVISWQWLYYKLYELRDEFNAVAKGAGQQNISADVVKKKEIILPSLNVIKQFTRVSDLLFKKRFILQKQAFELKEARDRLLPKLMSGEIEV